MLSTVFFLFSAVFIFALGLNINAIQNVFSSFANTSGVTYPNNTNSNIHIGIAGDYFVDVTQEKQKVGFVWNASHPNIAPTYTSAYQIFDLDGSPNATTSATQYAWYQKYHPDWLVYQCPNGHPSHTLATEFNDPQVPLDISNTHVLDYILSTYIYPKLAQGYNAIGFDDVNYFNMAHRCGIWQANQWVWLYPQGMSSYISSVNTWIAYMNNAIHARYPHAGIGANITIRNSYDLANYKSLVKYTNYIFDEWGFTNFGDSPSYITGQDWLKEIDFLSYLASHNQMVVVNAYEHKAVNDVSEQDIQWVLANYLLVKGNYTYTNIIPYGYDPFIHADSYLTNHLTWYSDFGVNIGYPTTGTYTQNLGANSDYYTIAGTRINRLTLTPHSGIILLRK